MLSTNNANVRYQRRSTSTITAYAPTLVLLLTSTCIFLLTAILGVWVAYDQNVAITRFIALASGLFVALVLALFIRNNREAWLAFVSLGFVLLILGFCTAFWLRLSVNSSLVAGELAFLLPLGASAVAWTWTRYHWSWTVMIIIALVIGVLTLVATNEQSAMLSLMTGFMSAILFYWRLGQGYRAWFGKLMDVVVTIVIVTLFITYWLLLTVPQSDELISGISMGDGLISRFQLWRTTLPLIEDYQFSGSGLGSTAMVYSTYIFLLHVPFHYHVHNLYLQIAVEQGVPGLIGFLGMVSATLVGLGSTYRQSHSSLRPFYVTVWMSTIVLVIYGLLDSEIYASGGVTFIFAPFGFALILLNASTNKRRRSGTLVDIGDYPRRSVRDSMAAVYWHRSQVWVVGCLPAVLITILWFGPGAQAAQQANWGAIAQTRAELAVYHWPDWPIQDAVRRSGIDLTAALHYYQAALALNPNNVTAHRRLGQIMLSLGDVESAQRHLAIAYAISPNQLVTRQLLGEVYGVTGKIEAAAALWRTVANSQDQLGVRYWWYEHLGAQTEAARIQEVIVKASQ